ncbi:hypothetical protein ACGFNU_08175 [Spirillospora sp. NPDC048911]|uniref:hypothetical protein n=1 Tax=Spirillospora sp. NPDC048911 TaxID=3364527 RepID=UPI00371F999F
MSAAFTLDRAAGEAERREWAPPRPDQWIYTHYRNVPVKQRWSLPGGDGGPGEEMIFEEQWQRADGLRSAVLEGGKLWFNDVTREQQPTWPPPDYAGLARLPDDPEALLALVYRHLGPPEEKSSPPPGVTDCMSPDDRAEFAFNTLLEILGANLLPPKVEAAVYRAMKKVPGVVVHEVDGMVALGRPMDGWRLNEVLFDARTYRYAGQRSTFTRDPAEVLEKGCGIPPSGLNMRVVSVGVVNQAGQRP